jgi:hypothetical protein
MTGLTGRRRAPAFAFAPERKLITANVRPVVGESNLCLTIARADSVDDVQLTEAPR